MVTHSEVQASPPEAMQGLKVERQAWQERAAAYMALEQVGQAAWGRPASMEWSMEVLRAQSLICARNADT